MRGNAQAPYRSLSLVRSTMVSFTQYLKKYSLLILVALLTSTFAIADGIQVKTAELVSAGDAYQLSADFDINFSPEVEDALNKGIPLNFLIEFQLVAPRRYWFDDEITTTSQIMRLSYHALSRQYLLNVGQHQKSFATLTEAREELAKVRDWIVVEKAQLAKNEPYQAVIRLRLDVSRLPKPLQVDAVRSDKWNLVSERYRWTPAFVSSKTD